MSIYAEMLDVAGMVPASYSVLGTVRAVSGTLVTVDFVRAGGASAVVALPAIHQVVYSAGDRVLVLFQSADPASGVVAGRIDQPADAQDGGWDGVGGHAHISLAAIGATPQVLIPAGAGNVGAMARIDAIITNGSARTFLPFTLTVGGTSTQNVTTGGDTWQFRLNGDGSVDVRRTAGSGSGTVTLRVLWV